MPGPIVLGEILDSSCLIWQEKCGDTGSCWVYENRSIGEKLSLSLLAVKCVSLTFFSLALFFYKPPKEDDVDDDVFDVNAILDTESDDGKSGGFHNDVTKDFTGSEGVCSTDL